VLKANQLYAFCFKIAELCKLRNVVCTIENPSRSYLWELKDWIGLLSSPDWYQCHFQNCMHGSSRDKWSLWLSNHPDFTQLCVSCSGDHSHEPWSGKWVGNKYQFDTAAEAEYPSDLCVKVAHIVRNIALEWGAEAPPSNIFEMKPDAWQHHSNKAVLGNLIRGRKLPQLVSEFGSFSTLSP
jgi:hypothetical protein